MEYLSKDTILRIINHQKTIPLFDREFLQEHIKLEAAADVVEVVHGYWIEVSLGLYKCSACDNHICGFDENIKKTKHCSYCGAKMDGERREDNDL